MCLSETTDDIEVVCGMCGKKMGQTTFNRDGHLITDHTCDDCDKFVIKHIDSLLKETYGAEKE